MNVHRISKIAHFGVNSTDFLPFSSKITEIIPSFLCFDSSNSRFPSILKLDPHQTQSAECSAARGPLPRNSTFTRVPFAFKRSLYNAKNLLPCSYLVCFSLLKKLFMKIFNNAAVVLGTILCGSFINRVESTCVSGWTENDNICYSVGATSITGPECRTYCSGISAAMICIPDSATNTFVETLASSGSGNGVWIAYKKSSSSNNFYWVDGCSSSFTQWKSSKPNGGNYVWTDRNGNWDDGDNTDLAKCGCQYVPSVAPTRTPTASPSTRTPTASPSTRTPTASPSTTTPTRKPSVSPTFVPTCKPTATPSLSPSAFPTYGGVVDCRSSCTLLSGSAVMAVGVGQKVATLRMPSHFRIQFDSTCAGLGTYPEVRNMLQIVSEQTGNEFFSVGMPDSNNLRVSYNGQVARAFGPTMSNPMWSTFTTITTGYGYGYVVTATSYATSDAVANFYESSVEETFSLFLSAAGTGSRSCAGSVKNIIISSTLSK